MIGCPPVGGSVPLPIRPAWSLSRSSQGKLPAPDVVLDAVLGVGDGGGACEPAVSEHSGGGVRGGERVGDDAGGSSVTGAADQRPCCRGGQASALAGGGDGVADLDLSPDGRPLEPAEADDSAVVVEEEM